MDQYKREMFNLKLQQALDSEESYPFLIKGSWLEGGCCALAMALQHLFPGSEVISTEDHRHDQAGSHFLLVLDTTEGPIYVDYDGLQTGQEYMDKMQKEWAIQNPMITHPDWKYAIQEGLVPANTKLRNMTKWLAGHLKDVLKIPSKYMEEHEQKPAWENVA